MRANLLPFQLKNSNHSEVGRAATLQACDTRLSDLRRWFGVPFTLIDGNTGEAVGGDGLLRPHHCPLEAELCRAVARCGKPEFVAEEGPLLLLAIPLHGEHPQAALAPFATGPICHDEDLAAAARLLGLIPGDGAAWLQRQSHWDGPTLMRMAELWLAKIAAQRHASYLETEVDNLSLHLSRTYEEISLLYRLTQNLKLTRTDEKMGSQALAWLAEVIQAESLAIQYNTSAPADVAACEAQGEPKLLTFGRCPVDAGGFQSLIERATPEKMLVCNSVDGGVIGQAGSEIRQLVVVPLAEGNNVIGWLAAFNHTQGQEFGTVEASLLSSVGAILGIHSGNIELYRQQAEFFSGVVRALTSAIDAKDPYTCGHSDRVARVAVRLAQELGLNAEQLNTIYLSGLLHDVGKIGIDDTVLRKPGALTHEEYEHIKTHAEVGYKILCGLRQLGEVLPVVLHHHEQWDGGGYPRGLAGEAIPLMARIVAVADAFDAMGSDRPYRKGMPEEKLDSILRAGAGKQWDAQVTDAFFRARGDIREISGRERSNLGLDVREWT